MFYHTASNKHVREGVPFSIPFEVSVTRKVSVNGVMTDVTTIETQETQYPSNWLNLSTPEEKEELGLVEVITEGTRADERTHHVSEELDGPVLRIVNTPKPAEQLALLESREIATALATFRKDRLQMFFVIASMSDEAKTNEDEAVVAALHAFRQGLKDLPAWPAVAAATTYTAFALALVTRYRQLTSALPASPKAYFKELMA